MGLKDKGYKNNSLEQEEIISEYLPYIKHMAGRMSVGLPPHIDKDDLISCGFIGLMDALKRYDPQKGNFKNYALTRAKGAMVDELRKLSWTPRSVLQKTKAMEEARQRIATERGSEPSFEEIAKTIGWSKEEANLFSAQINTMTVLSLEEFLFVGDDQGMMRGDTVIDEEIANQPGESLEKAERNQALEKAIESLAEREQILLSLYYQEDLTLKEIGSVLSVSESRVSQLHSKIMLKLRNILKDW